MKDTMDLVSLALVFGVLAILVFYIYQNGKPERNHPPGPWRLPFIGNALEIGGFSTHLRMQKLAAKYGPIMSIKLGPLNMVVLSDAKIIKEAFSLPVFSGRADIETFTLMSGGKYGIVNSDGDTWVEQRRFSVRHLRDLGFGKTYMEDLIMEEVNELLIWLKAEENMPISLDKRFSMAVLNSIWMLIHGRRYGHDDPRLMELFQKNHEATGAVVKAGVLFLVPWVAKLVPDLSGYNKIMSLIQGFRGFFKESICEHEAVLQDEGPARDLVEAYLREMKKSVGTESSFNEINGMKNLLGLITDMFVAGHDTTSSTLQWLFLYVTRTPGVQSRIHKELDRVVGNSRRVTLADKPDLVYLEAVLLETLRISSIAALGVFHTATEDVDFHGFRIPKGCLISANFWGIHHDSNTWTEPEEFRPQRFISPQDGKKIINSDKLMPFSTGKRACVGELMARNELFLFAGNIFQRFTVAFDPASPQPTIVPGSSFVLTPLPYKVIMKDRLK